MGNPINSVADQIITMFAEEGPAADQDHQDREIRRLAQENNFSFEEVMDAVDARLTEIFKRETQ